MVLSKREVEVFREVVTGRRNKEIGERLFVTEKTIKFHLGNIYRKLSVRSRHEMISKWFSGEFPADLLGPHFALISPAEPPTEAF